MLCKWIVWSILLQVTGFVWKVKIKVSFQDSSFTYIWLFRDYAQVTLRLKLNTGGTSHKSQGLQGPTFCLLDHGLWVAMQHVSQLGGQPDAGLSLFSPQAFVVLIFIEPLKEWKAESTLPNQMIKPKTCGTAAWHLITLGLPKAKFYVKYFLLMQNP